MSDKFPWGAAEVGSWKETAPNPHVNLNGNAVNFGTGFPSRTFTAAAADTDVDFDSGDTCQVMIIDATNKANWVVYAGAAWVDAATDYLDLSSAMRQAHGGSIAVDALVNVWVIPPIGRFLPDAEGHFQGDLAQIGASGEWTVI